MWPDSFLGKLGRILGALSMLRLIELGFASNFGSVIGALLEYYEKLLGWLFWPIEPLVRAWLAQLYLYIGWPKSLYPHWRHVFVLLQLYFLRNMEVSRLYSVGFAIFNFLLGILVALTFGVAAGTFPLDKADRTSQFLFVAALILGAAIYAAIGFIWEALFVLNRWMQARSESHSAWQHFKWGLKRIAVRSLVGFGLLGMLLNVPFIQELSAPGVVISFFLIIAFSVYWLGDGIRDARKTRRADESLVAAYLRSPFTQLGLAMLGPIFWCFVFIVMRAGNT
jgi:hypothetical protein